MVRKISLLASVITFVLVFHYFYAVPILPASATIPKAYVAPDDQPTQVIVHVDRGSVTAYEFWYEWPYDGFYKKLDKEPVIVYVKDGRIYAVAFRIHYNWRVVYDPPTYDSRVLVWFVYRWHTPQTGTPPSNYIPVRTRYVYGAPPENVDVWSIVTIPNPLNNPFVAGVTWGAVSAVIVYVLSSRLSFISV